MNENLNKIIILGAHYDSRAQATRDPDPSKRDEPVPGANDGASGSAVLIELAKAFYKVRDNLSCQIWFLFFDAEDQGRDNDYGIDGWSWCEGSTAFVSEINNYYNSAIENLESMILFDMVGGTNLQFIDEQYSTSSLLDEIFATGRSLGFTAQFPSNPISNSIVDDHRAFINIGIPAADLIINFWSNPNWPFHHTTQDTLSNIANNSLEITGKTVEQFIYNNYLNTTTKVYKGNYPWFEDIDRALLEIFMFIVIIVAIGGIIILALNIIKLKSHSNKVQPKRKIDE